MVRKYHIFKILEIDVKQVECKDRNGEVTNKAIAHQKRELHEPGEICVSVSRQFKGAQKYQGDLLRGIYNKTVYIGRGWCPKFAAGLNI